MALTARRSGLVALDVTELAWAEQDLRVTIRRSKTDQDGEGAVVVVPEAHRLNPTHPTASLARGRSHQRGAGLPADVEGWRVRPARLSDQVVARIVQARTLAAGLDPARYVMRSLRTGFVAAAVLAGTEV